MATTTTTSSPPAPAPPEATINPDQRLPTGRKPVNLNPSFLITFPPFPTPPVGTRIVPFKEFKERGIRLEPEEDKDPEIETDTLGIPTVPMSKRHATDEPKSSARKRRFLSSTAAPAEAGALPVGERKGWITSRWESGEVGRRCFVDPRGSQSMRLFDSAKAFRDGREWPPPQRLVGLVDLWDLFRRFIGVPDVSSKRAPESDDDEVVDAISDDDAPTAAEAEELPAGVITTSETGIITPASLQAMQNAVRDEENSTRFLDDPEGTVRVFLSSYAKDKGYLYSDSNLFNIPHLTTYFLSFLIRNLVFPELDRELKAALSISQRAERELPAVGRAGKVLPDTFAKGCVECWGTRGVGYRAVGIVWGEGEKVAEKEEEGKGGLGEVDERGWKKAEFETSGWGENGSGWGEKDSGWGNKDSGWGGDNTDTGSGWGQPAPTPADDPWSLVTPATNLLFLLGPTALPLTHTPGIIETSMRRVVSFTPPPEANRVMKCPVADEPDADAVEAELERVCARVVLAPWLGWNVTDEYEHVSVPRVVEGSKGAWVDPSSPPPSETESTPGGLKPHNPITDLITVLVSPETYASLDPIEGMGIAGTWVQLARVSDVSGEGEVVKKKKKKGKGGKKEERGRFWYLDDASLNIPSFWKQLPKKEKKAKPGRKGKKVLKD